MANFKQNKTQSLPFVCSNATKTKKNAKMESKMLCIKLKKILLLAMLMFVGSSVLFATNKNS